MYHVFYPGVMPTAMAVGAPAFGADPRLVGSGMAMPPPAPGQVRMTPFPDDDERSIGFELDQMVGYVREARKDMDFVGLVRDVMGSVAEYEGRPDYRLAQAAAWDAWCRRNVQYLNDPVSWHCAGNGT